MSDRGIAGLLALAEDEPVLAPLARMEALTLGAAEAEAWNVVQPDFSEPDADAPLLHGRRLPVPLASVRSLAEAMLADPAVSTLIVSLTDRPLPEQDVVLVSWLEAAIAEDDQRLAPLLTDWGDAAESLAALLKLALLPVLQACGRLAAPLLAQRRWEQGYCPVCAAWPTLVELRGTERLRRLRCGRCGTGWSSPAGRCPFCANSDAHSQRYLAEGEDATARAEVCEHCHGYLKAVATPFRLSPAEILLHDLETLDLDDAVTDAGYQRPSGLGAPLSVTVVPL